MTMFRTEACFDVVLIEGGAKIEFDWSHGSQSLGSWVGNV